jgi:hypothetical protein
MNNYFVHVSDTLGYGTLDIYIGQRDGDRISVLTIDENGSWVFKEYVQDHTTDSTLQPSLRIPLSMREFVVPELLQKLADMGNKPKQQATLEGELTATRCHLADLRALLKLK